MYRSKIAAVTIAAALLASCSAEDILPEGGKAAKADGEMRVHFIDVGQGDSTFAELPNGETLLIDAGETDRGQDVVTYIQQLGYDEIDYAVCTHPHSDHIGGMADVSDYLKVDKAYLSPADGDSLVYSNLLEKLDENEVEQFRAGAGDCIVSDEALTVDIIAPGEGFDWGDNPNNASLVVRVTYGENTFVIMGDAEKQESSEIKDIDCDVLRTAHHGSGNGTYEELLDAASPEYAVVSCGLNNEYGHPHKNVVDMISERGIKLFRTDEQGSVVISSDGEKLTASVSPVKTEKSAGEKTASDKDNESSVSEKSSDSESTYVLNTSTKKIHKAGCGSVASISEHNRAETDDYEAAIAEGYSPCGVCKPDGSE